MPENLGQAEGGEDVLRCVTNLVRNIFGVDIAAVSLIEGRQQRFRSIQGLEIASLPLEASFCRASWREGRMIVISDTALDAEFHDHPLVTGPMSLRAYAGVPLRTSTGEMIGTLCAIHSEPRTFTERELVILNDLATLAATELELHEYATCDSLTGALTRRAFVKAAGRLREAAFKRDLPLSVILFDVDHFKSINDRYGHAAGDRVLQCIASTCQDNLGGHAVFGRLGGEEFGVVVAASLRAAEDTAELLRATIAALPFHFAGQTVHMTASFGISAVGEGSDALSEAVSHADAALYLAKAKGRNRSVTTDLATLLEFAEMTPAATRKASA